MIESASSASGYADIIIKDRTTSRDHKHLIIIIVFNLFFILVLHTTHNLSNNLV